MKAIKRFINKITPLKIIIFIVLIFSLFISSYMIVAKYTTQKALSSKLVELKEILEAPVSEDLQSTSSEVLYRILSTGDSIVSVDSITELDSKSKDLRVVKDLTLNDLSRMSNSNLVDFTITTGDAEKTLAYIAKSKVVCEYVSVEDDKINCRILVRGDN